MLSKTSETAVATNSWVIDIFGSLMCVNIYISKHGQKNSPKWTQKVLVTFPVPPYGVGRSMVTRRLLQHACAEVKA